MYQFQFSFDTWAFSYRVSGVKLKKTRSASQFGCLYSFSIHFVFLKIELSPSCAFPKTQRFYTFK